MRREEPIEWFTRARPRRGLWTLLLTLGLLASTGCFRDHPNVLVVAMDACRPDKMGCYGLERPASPAIDALAADPDAVVFDRHYSQANWTKPSTASLFTGLHVRQHRLTADELEPGSSWLPYLHPDLPTMAEHFHQAGYFTWALVKIPHLDPMFGFGRGFDIYERRPVADGRLAREALALLGLPREKPFFGYMHFLACHYPFKPRDRDRDYILEYAKPYPELERAEEAGIDFREPWMQKRIVRRGLELEEHDVEFLNTAYEAKMRQFNERALGPLIEGLKERGLYDNTLIVLTADHGEELYDHEGYGHGHALWDEVIRLPLIVKFPKGERPRQLGARSAELSRTIDLFPSLSWAAGLRAPKGIPGTNVFRGEGADLVLSETGNSWAVIQGDDKLILTNKDETHLFDLGEDQAERIDLKDLSPETVEALREATTRRRAEDGRPTLGPYEWAENPLPNEAIEELRSLGYVD